MSQTKGGKTEKYIIISKLADLYAFKDEAFSKTCSNLFRVFQYNVKEIQYELIMRDFGILKGLRDNLLTKLYENETFTAYTGKPAINRLVSSTIFKDIMILGSSLANNETNDNLDSVFKSKIKLEPMPDLKTR